MYSVSKLRGRQNRGERILGEEPTHYSDQEHRLWYWTAKVQIPALPLNSLCNLGKLLSVAQFLYLLNEDIVEVTGLRIK